MRNLEKAEVEKTKKPCEKIQDDASSRPLFAGMPDAVPAQTELLHVHFKPSATD